MKKSKLLAVCMTLAAEEWRSLEDFTASPFFNKDPEVTRLCRHLHALAKRDFPADELDREVVWRTLYPRAPFDRKTTAYLMSDLLQLIETFLGYRYLADRPAGLEPDILAALAARRLDKSYQFRRKRLERDLARSPREDADHLYLRYRLATVADDYFNAGGSRRENPYLGTRDQALNDYFTHVKLQLFCHMLNEAAVLGSEYVLTWPPVPTEESPLPADGVLTRTYHCLFQLLSHPQADDDLFARYQNLLADLHEHAPAEERINLYYFAINYCLQALKKGRRAYADKLLTLYQDGLSSGNLLVNGELSPWIYKNIVKLGLGLKRFAWVERFITAYSERLPSADRHDALYFNLSDLHYHQRDYDAALHYLNQIEFSDIFYKHGTKIMLLKIYFEKRETEAFLSLAGSYRLMLLRERGLSAGTLNAYKNFVRLAVKVYKARERLDNRREKLTEEIRRTKNINARQWLLEQVNTC